MLQCLDFVVLVYFQISILCYITDQYIWVTLLLLINILCSIYFSLSWLAWYDLMPQIPQQKCELEMVASCAVQQIISYLDFSR